MSPTNRGYSPAAAPGRHNATTPHLCSQPSLFSSPFVLSLFMLFTLPLPPSEYTDSLCPQKEPDVLVTHRENRGFQMQCLIHCCFRKPICPLPCPAFLLTLFLCHVSLFCLNPKSNPFLSGCHPHLHSSHSHSTSQLLVENATLHQTSH